MLIKIYRGTSAQTGESLCDTCRFSRIIRGRRLDEEIVLCTATMMDSSIPVSFKVTSCSEYLDDRQPSYQELFEKAWILRPATKKRPAGFVRSADLPPEYPRRALRDRDSDHE